MKWKHRHRHTRTHTHTYTPCKNVFPTLSLNLPTPRFPLWRSFSKPNRQQAGSLRAARRCPGRGAPAPRRARGSSRALHFLLAFSSLDTVAGGYQDGTPAAQGAGGHPCLMWPGQGSGCCSSQVAHSGDLPGAGRGVRWQGIKAGPWGPAGHLHLASKVAFILAPPPVGWVGLLLTCGGL